MSKAEILEEIPKLTPEERNEIRMKLEEFDDLDGTLTPEEWAIVDARIADMEKHPEKAIPWEEAKARLKARFGV